MNWIKPEWHDVLKPRKAFPFIFYLLFVYNSTEIRVILVMVAAAFIRPGYLFFLPRKGPSRKKTFHFLPLPFAIFDMKWHLRLGAEKWRSKIHQWKLNHLVWTFWEAWLIELILGPLENVVALNHIVMIFGPVVQYLLEISRYKLFHSSFQHKNMSEMDFDHVRLALNDFKWEHLYSANNVHMKTKIAQENQKFELK